MQKASLHGSKCINLTGSGYALLRSFTSAACGSKSYAALEQLYQSPIGPNMHSGIDTECTLSTLSGFRTVLTCRLLNTGGLAHCQDLAWISAETLCITRERCSSWSLTPSSHRFQLGGSRLCLPANDLCTAQWYVSCLLINYVTVVYRDQPERIKGTFITNIDIKGTLLLFLLFKINTILSFS